VPVPNRQASGKQGNPEPADRSRRISKLSAEKDVTSALSYDTTVTLTERLIAEYGGARSRTMV